MPDKENLQKLNYLIKELNDTHSRVQNMGNNYPEIEIALLSQQVVTIYGHLQNLLKDTQSIFQSPDPEQQTSKIPEIKNSGLIESEVQPIRLADVDRKKALLQSTLNETPVTVIKPIEEFKSEEKPLIQEEIIVAKTNILPTNDNLKRVPEDVQLKAEVSDQSRNIAPQHNVVEQSLYEKLAKTSEPSLNERFTGIHTKQNLGDKLKQVSISDLKSAIGLNQKVAFINTLFRGGDKDYKNAIATLNSFTNYSEARAYIKTELATKFNWDENNSITQDFINLVSRRFS
jgi:hypothetical protein